ncbi:hypothetical protein [Bifidobacterium apri]|uniref:hypothetical protein n=1 Tax=Bifidobacterium apri TaxID=1769423 RepID=UPI0012660E15|nr:hypothetical protein [Bifidobacterium apri]
MVDFMMVALLVLWRGSRSLPPRALPGKHASPGTIPYPRRDAFTLKVQVHFKSNGDTPEWSDSRIPLCAGANRVD